MAFNIEKAKAAGYTDAQIAEYLAKKQPPKTETGYFSNLEQAYFPTASKMPEPTTIGGHLKTGLASILDLAGAPKRALGGNMADPNSNILNKPASFVESLLPENRVGNWMKGNVEVGKDVVGDPLTALGLGTGKGLSMLLRKTPEIKLADLATKSLKAEQSIPGIMEAQSKIGGEELIGSKAPSRGLVESLVGRIPENDRSILSEKLLPKETPFTDYSKIAKVAVKNPRNMTSFDYAGSMAKKAFDELDNQRKIAGAAKQAILEGNAEKTISASDIKTKWFKELYDKIGFAGFDKEGNVIAIKGRTIRAPGDIGTVKDIDKIITNLPDEISVQQADDIKSAIRDIIDKSKASQVKQMKTTAEGIGTGIRKQIDDSLGEVLGPAYKAANKEYAETIQLQKWLNSRLGETVGNQGVTRHGGSLMKSAVQSAADRGAKASFDAIKKKTGYDLVKEAKYAEIAGKTVEDPRAWNLLEEAHGTNTGSGIVDMLLQVGKKGYNKLNPKIDEYDRFYEAMQRKHLKGDL